MHTNSTNVNYNQAENALVFLKIGLFETFPCPYLIWKQNRFD